MDTEFDQLCSELLFTEFDHIPSFDFEDFDSSSQTSSSDVTPKIELSSGTKRRIDEVDSDQETAASVQASPSDSKVQKTDDLLKDQRLKAITDLINALNECENESIERLLREEYDENLTVKINHQSEDIYSGRNAMLLLWVATHEAYPDGMYKVLEKRSLNMTVPRGKAGVQAPAIPKVEFVYKFSGTKIMPGNLNSLIKNFVLKHEDYTTYGPDKLSDKLLQFVAMSDVAFEAESSQNIIGEATLGFLPDGSKVTEVTLNILACGGR